MRDGQNPMFALYEWRTSNTTVYATDYEQVMVIHVRLQWMALIISQVILTAVVLAFVIHKTQMNEMEALKGSSIASLCVLDPRMRSDIGRLSDIQAARKDASGFNVRLERNELEYQLRMVHTTGPHIDEEQATKIYETISK